MSSRIDMDVTGDFPGLITAPPGAALQEFLEFLTLNKPFIQEKLLQHGGLLFRGFPINKAEDFANVIEVLGLGNFVNYIGGDSPRNKVTKNVYTSTEAPPAFHIPLHQELSFIKHHPKHIYFYCEIAPKDRGETIIGDARRIYASIPDRIKQTFEQEKITYISRYYFKSNLMRLVNKIQRSHKSWEEVFETDDKQEVEKKCLDNDFEWFWLANDWLEVQQTRPSSIKHAETNEWVWFNQAHLYDFNPKLLGFAKYWGAKLFYFKKSMRLHEVQFASGKKIPRQDLYAIMEILNKNTVAFPWKKSDVLVLDNVLAMHGRAPFSGARRILAAMTS